VAARRIGGLWPPGRRLDRSPLLGIARVVSTLVSPLRLQPETRAFRPPLPPLRGADGPDVPVLYNPERPK